MSVLAVTLATAGSAAAKSAPTFDVYVGDVQRDALAKIVALGVDRSEIDLSAAKASGKNAVHVEAIMNAEQAARLGAQGVDVAPKKIDSQTVAQRATLQAAAGYNVFKKYSGRGGLKEEYIQAALRN